MPRFDTIGDVRRSFFARMARPLLFVCALFYLGFHTVSGERSVFALFKETKRLESLKAELQEVTAKREALEKKVRLLSSSSLDLDMLDEQARLVLGLVGKNEVVYFMPETQK